MKHVVAGGLSVILFIYESDVLICGEGVFTVTGDHVIWLTELRQLTVKEVGIP